MRILLNGAAGKMGRTMAAAILAEPDLELAAAVDVDCLGQDAGQLAQGRDCGVVIEADLAAAIARTGPDAMLDFTNPASVLNNIRIALGAGLACVVGTTGLSQARLEELDVLARSRDTGLLVAPNFAISAVLMMRFAAEAVKYLPDYEIIELHHDKKLDAPSGTALYTAQLMGENRLPHVQGRLEESQELEGCRGGDYQGARIHSMRLPGVVAQQQVVLAAPGQLLRISQESANRDCFWPGVRLGLRRISAIKGLVYGLDKLL